MTSSGVTHTGQPGPWIISIPDGSSWSMPWRMIEWVWPPHTSMIAHGRVVTAWIRSSSRAARAGSANSSRYFTAVPPASRAAAANPSPNSSSSNPSRSNSARVSSAERSSSRWIANPTCTIT